MFCPFLDANIRTICLADATRIHWNSDASRNNGARSHSHTARGILKSVGNLITRVPHNGNILHANKSASGQRKSDNAKERQTNGP